MFANPGAIPEHVANGLIEEAGWCIREGCTNPSPDQLRMRDERLVELVADYAIKQERQACIGLLQTMGFDGWEKLGALRAALSAIDMAPDADGHKTLSPGAIDDIYAALRLIAADC
jgi:hypothetical protein